jgi:anaerobic selenocysteine-containing dehydrogenase
MTGESKIWHHYRTCNLCEAMCGLDFTMQGRSIVKIEGDRQDAFSRGHICPKAVALQDIHNDPNRLKRPLRRTKNGWREIGWAEAFDETTDRIKEIQAKHGRHAFGSYQGNPGVHNYGTILFFPPFIRTLKSKNIFSASSVDQLPHMIASYFMFGHQLLLPIPDINRTQHFLILGANPAVSNGSLMTAPDVANRIREIRARGGKVTVIDPRRTETAQLADEHHFIRPGADAFLLLGVLHVIFAEKLENPRRLAELSDNLDAVRALVADFAPEAVADITGISAAEIKRIAREFAKAESAVCYARVGVSTQEFGTIAHWLVNVLNIVTGNFDREGGSMFANPAIDPLDSFPAGHYGVWKSRVRGLPEFAGELPVAALAEEILTEGEGKIRGLLTVAGNPVLSTPNGKQLESALAGLEFMASVDIYVNETTRHAHIILPPTGALEHENYDLIFHVLAIENTAKYSPALFAPDADARHDWQIFLELHTRMISRSPVDTLKAQARKGFYMGLGPEGMLDLALRSGAYGAGWNPFSDGLHLEKIKASPHGVHLGPLRPSLPGRLRTKTKRIELAPAVIVADVQRVREKLAAPAAPAAFNGDTLLLIGRRHLRSNNSWMHNSERLVKGKPRCTLLMHPNDARKRNLADGQTVRLDSRVGGVEVPVEITDEVMPGVVSLPHGWGHNRPGVQLDVARRLAGASVNDVTDERFLDALSGNASFNGVPVRVTAA